jgi:hypothetical protein
LSSGTYAGTNAITLSGTSNGTAVAYGVSMVTGATLTAPSGNINITGTNVGTSGIYAGAAITATTGNVTMIGVASASASSSAVNLLAAADITAGGNISISGTSLSTSSTAAGVRFAGAVSPAYEGIVAGGSISVNGYIANSSASIGNGVITAGTVYFQSAGNTTISGAAPNSVTSNTGVSLNSVATNVGGNFTVQGSTLATVTNASGASIPSVAQPAPGTAAYGGSEGIYYLNDATLTISGKTYTGINAVGNISMVGQSSGAGWGFYDMTAAITSSAGNISIAGTSTSYYGLQNSANH